MLRMTIGLDGEVQAYVERKMKEWGLSAEMVTARALNLLKFMEGYTDKCGDVSILHPYRQGTKATFNLNKW